MEANVKAILIDVKNQEVKEVEHDNTLQNIYDLIDCRVFDSVRIDNVNSIFVDDEGIEEGIKRGLDGNKLDFFAERYAKKYFNERG